MVDQSFIFFNPYLCTIIWDQRSWFEFCLGWRTFCFSEKLFKDKNIVKYLYFLVFLFFVWRQINFPLLYDMTVCPVSVLRVDYAALFSPLDCSCVKNCLHPYFLQIYERLFVVNFKINFNVGRICSSLLKWFAARFIL